MNFITVLPHPLYPSKTRPFLFPTKLWRILPLVIVGDPAVLQTSAVSCSCPPWPWVIGQVGGPLTPSAPNEWAGHSKMAALASSLIRQRREVKDPQANRQISTKRKPCPKSNKSLCQKQILILISKVRLCGSRGRKLEKDPVSCPKHSKSCFK